MIDDVNKVLGFSNTPENFANTGKHFPVIRNPGPGQFAYITVCPLVIILINTIKKLYIKVLRTIVPFVRIFRFSHCRQVTVMLFRAQRIFKKYTCLTTDITREFTAISGAGMQTSTNRKEDS